MMLLGRMDGWMVKTIYSFSLPEPRPCWVGDPYISRDDERNSLRPVVAGDAYLPDPICATPM
jgi:hypothetical protein